MLRDASGESAIELVDKNGTKRTVYRYRDIVKKVYGSTCLAILACENQSEIHYGMAVRNMLYDALSYSEQVQQLEEEHKKNKDLRGSKAFLSGLSETDRLVPVMTIVFYYGKEPWNNSSSLLDLINIPTELQDIAPFIPDYRLNVIQWNNVNSKNFKTDLRKIFELLPFAKDKNGMINFVNRNKQEYETLDEKTYKMLLAVLDDNQFFKKHKAPKGEVINMCKAFDDMREEGREQGREESLLSLVKKKLKQNMSCQEIADWLEEPLEQITTWCTVIQQYPDKSERELAVLLQEEAGSV